MALVQPPVALRGTGVCRRYNRQTEAVVAGGAHLGVAWASDADTQQLTQGILTVTVPAVSSGSVSLGKGRKVTGEDREGAPWGRDTAQLGPEERQQAHFLSSAPTPTPILASPWG